MCIHQGCLGILVIPGEVVPDQAVWICRCPVVVEDTDSELILARDRIFISNVCKSVQMAEAIWGVGFVKQIEDFETRPSRSEKGGWGKDRGNFPLRSVEQGCHSPRWMSMKAAVLSAKIPGFDCTRSCEDRKSVV